MDAPRVPDRRDGGPHGTAGPATYGPSRLTHAFVAALLTRDAAVDELRRATQTYVADLKALGRTSSQVVIAVKEAVASVPLPPRLHVDDIAACREQVVRWCIAAYFRDD